VELDAEHRPLVTSSEFVAHVQHPSDRPMMPDERLLASATTKE
jgi:hypothetical protein